MFRSLIIFFMLIVFVGCGDDDSVIAPLPTSEGKLIDSVLEGVEYETVSMKGVTNSNGVFRYAFSDNSIIFKLGDMELAEFPLSKLNSDKKILPCDLFGVDRKNTTDVRVVKLIRFLQSLDDDNNLTNGITITKDTKNIISSTMDNNDSISQRFTDNNISILEMLISKTGKKLISQRKARQHYKSTLLDMNVTVDPVPFISVWNTKSADGNITIPVDKNYDYDYNVEWGDGDINLSVKGDITHTYSNEGNHTIKITGVFPAISLYDNHTKFKTLKIVQWGDIEWKSMKKSFSTYYSLESNATDTPDLSQVTDMSYMFAYTNVNFDISNWDVSHIENMEDMFKYSVYFNQDISSWDVSNVTNMYEMFFRCSSFNQDISSWDVSNVTDMGSMFYFGSNFNQDLSSWNVSNVEYMDQMFYMATNFNQDISSWDVGSVTRMDKMFYKATNFNQDISSWDVSNVTSMYFMFCNAENFNQDISSWDVSNVTRMQYMLYGTSAFKNHDLSGWDVSKVITHASFMENSGSGNIEPNWL